MLDANINKLFSFEARVPDITKEQGKILLLRACKVYIFENGRIYSGLEEETFDNLNRDVGYGALDIEFVFANNILKKSYPLFYTKCFYIRTDTKAHIKPMKMTCFPCNSKVNQNGELVIGVRYYFMNDEEIEQIINCKDFLVEGFIAIEKPRNVFGVMCQLKKEEDRWEITSAYTYKPKSADNIKYLFD
ncbi:MAG: hypothetical protein J1E61_05620 [Lachnospiraceae bacterium]|nr:hypothetical protein [Lachnospiraceae bacterium]